MRLSNHIGIPKVYMLCVEYDEQVDITFDPMGVNGTERADKVFAIRLDAVEFASTGRIMLRLKLPSTFFVDGNGDIYIADDPNKADEMVIKRRNSTLRLVRTSEPGTKAND